METQNAATCHGRNENELTVQQLLNDGSPLFLHPPSDPTVAPPPPTSLLSKDDLNRLVAGVYSGPRIQDVENALSATSGHHYQQAQQEQTRLSFLERGLNKIENNYTLKMKCCSNGTADDGYKWRKYGQKSIKNSPHPRSYYKCTSPRCNAKKQVERSTTDPDMLMITYEGLHLHFIYPYFPYNQAQQQLNPPTKRPKKAAKVQREAREAEQATNTANQESLQELGLENEFGPQGLLEDVVPLIIRNPSCTAYVSSNNSSSSCSSYHSQSAPNSPSSLSWSPNYSPCFDIGINMSIM